MTAALLIYDKYMTCVRLRNLCHDRIRKSGLFAIFSCSAFQCGIFVTVAIRIYDANGHERSHAEL